MPAANYNVPTPDDRATIVCLYCDKPQEVSRRALSVTCKFCNKALKLEDIRITQYQARRTVDTCGVVTIEKKGQIVADKILCGGLSGLGELQDKVTSRSTVMCGAEYICAVSR